MKIDLNSLTDEDLEDIVKNNETIVEEQLEQKDLKKRRKETENRNTKKIMRR